MKNRHLPATFALVALIGTTGCGGGSGSPTGPTTPGTASTPAQPSVSADLPSTSGLSTPGLYQDGLGTYPPGHVYLSPDARSLFAQPQCPGSNRGAPREFNLVLPQTTRDVVVGRLATCGTYGIPGEQIYVHLPDLLMRQTGAVIGSSAPANSSDISISVSLYLDVDSNGDGKIQAPPDDHYAIRWQKGLYLKQRSETATTTVYELTSLATEFGSDLSCSAELLQGNTPLGEISKGFHCLPLVLTVTLHK